MTTSARSQRPAARPGRGGRAPAAGSSRRSARTARHATQPRRVGIAGGWLQRRREPQKSGIQKAVGGLSGAVSGLGKGRSKAGGSPSKAKRGGQVGGLALLTAAAAGLAFKNRDKLSSTLDRDRSGRTSPAAASGTADGSAAGLSATEVPGAPATAPSTGGPEGIDRDHMTDERGTSAENVRPHS